MSWVPLSVFSPCHPFERCSLSAPDEAEYGGHIHQVGERVRLHLSHHATSVCLHRDLADAELATDLLIQQSGDDQRHDLPFARAEGRVTGPECPYLRLVIEGAMAALDSVPDSAQQRVVAERLRQELD